MAFKHLTKLFNGKNYLINMRRGKEGSVFDFGNILQENVDRQWKKLFRFEQAIAMVL